MTNFDLIAEILKSQQQFLVADFFTNCRDFIPTSSLKKSRG